ncbi:MAG TPA: class I SAM-dependent methyltransferase [Acidimicrobiales bacterium]|nr:class I SAM-dependent methyltransferase [Acidimicrobiales bacterium]
MAAHDDGLTTPSPAGPPTTREWDAASYDRISTPQVRWVTGLLGHLRPEGVELVLDAGCGTGRVTEEVLERLPRARVVALDGSRRMLDAAARRRAPAVDAGRVSFVHADLARPLALEQPVDAIFSTATFHWVLDHDALFANLAAVLRPGGQLVAQFGGAGNVASVVAALETLGEAGNPLHGAGNPLPGAGNPLHGAGNPLHGAGHPWHFADEEETRERLLRAGFTDVRTWMQEEPTPFEPGAPLEEFLATVVLGCHLERLAPEERSPFVKRVAAALPSPVLDYVRLNVVARRGGGR